MFYNCKNYFSIVLQAVADAQYRFIIIDVGGFGKQSDDGTFWASDLFKLMEEGNLNIPEDCALPSTTIIMPFVFIGDEAYPLLRHLLKPYSAKTLDAEREYYNMHLSRARKVVECAFGIMNANWQPLWKPIETSPEIATQIIKAICVLHNTIIHLEGPDMTEADNQPTGGSAVPTHLGRSNNRPTAVAQAIRDTFKSFA